MTEEITHPALAPAVENGNGHEPDGSMPSTLDWLRKRHEQLAADRTYDFDVPGYDGRLVLRCGPVPWKAMGNARALAAASEDDDGEELLALNSDVVIAACRAVLVRNDDEQLVSIDDSADAPVRIGKRLAELLDAQTTTARATLRWLFPNELSIARAASELLSWTDSASIDDAETFASE